MKQGEITYRFETPVYSGNILYVNLIARYSCVNNCLFCSKPETYGKENIYEQKAGANLFLSKSPSVETVIALIDKKIQKKDT
ncbi:MAG: hypothetical protein KKC26_06460, partial [Nanoarchaeota archaeon]|nr:hypothetical protein [Nanoarchaeota archaeon]